MTQLATLHIDKQAHKFSAAHFTIFPRLSGSGCMGITRGFRADRR
ncbi:MAG: hypothetical protein CM15mP74_21540 [Halieaceae bacterium]|nr:MAG: hypothetical protein CM15mP74_21540 [Halieaceae bacterium]